ERLQKDNQLAAPDQVLLDMISDRSFVRAAKEMHKTILDDEEKDKQFAKGQEDLDAARTKAWALTYFLMQRKLPQMERYLQELSALPRDMEFDDAVHTECFARAFNLLDAKEGRLNPQAVSRLANEWIAMIRRETYEIPELKGFMRKLSNPEPEPETKVGP